MLDLVSFYANSMFEVHSLEAKNKVFEFDYQKINMFKSVECLKNDGRGWSMFDKMGFDQSLTLI